MLLVILLGHNRTLYKIKSVPQWYVAYLGHNLVVVNTINNTIRYNITVTHSTEIVLGQEFMKKSVSKKSKKDEEKEVVEGFETSWKTKTEVKRTFSELGFAKGSVPSGYINKISYDLYFCCLVVDA